jgi:hypothetical protein
MKIITTRELRKETKTFFDLAERERIAIKRGKKYVNLIVSNDPDKKYVDEDWIREFMSIPEKYRCNPFEISPTGDLFFADRRNVEHIDQAIRQAKEGKVKELTPELRKELFGEV